MTAQTYRFNESRRLAVGSTYALEGGEQITITRIWVERSGDNYAGFQYASDGKRGGCCPHELYRQIAW